MMDRYTGLLNITIDYKSNSLGSIELKTYRSRIAQSFKRANWKIEHINQNETFVFLIVCVQFKSSE